MSRKQFTIASHFENLKVSHEDPQEINIFTSRIKEVFKNINCKIYIARGRNDEYWGINKEFYKNSELKVSIIPYVKILNELLINRKITIITLEVLFLFKSNVKFKELN